MHVSFTIDIESDLSTVFSWISNPDKARVWMTSVSAVEIIDARPGLVGTTFREGVEEDGSGIECTDR